MNERADRRLERRALTQDEIGRLLWAAESGDVVHGMTGWERSLLYRLAIGTGFRWNEIYTLTRGDFDFDGGVVRIRAENAKNRKDADQPLPADLIPNLREYMALFMPNAKAFPIMWNQRGAEMLHVDFEAAGVPIEDECGGRIDFHALRHTFGTMGAKSGISLAVMQKLMRHSDPRLTANLYTHVLIQDKARNAKNP